MLSKEEIHVAAGAARNWPKGFGSAIILLVDEDNPDDPLPYTDFYTARMNSANVGALA